MLQIKKIIFAVVLCIAASKSFAQREKPKNLENFDKKMLHFGFSLGLNYANSIVKYNSDKMLTDSLLILEPFGVMGFGLGIVTDFKMGENFNLRFIPSLSFLERDYYYKFCSDCKLQFPTTRDTTIGVSSTQIDFPLSVKFKSERVNNYRWYIITGLKYSMDLASNKGVSNNDILLKFQKNDLAYELGLGLDFYLNYFKFSPEIKFSFGSKNMLVQENTAYSGPIQSLKTKTIFISFLFE